MQQPFFTGLKFALSCAIIKKKARSDTVKRLMYAAPKYLAVIAACVAAFFIQQAFAFAHGGNVASFVDYGGVFRVPDVHIFGLSLYYVLMIFGLLVTIAFALLRAKAFGFGVVTAVLIPVGCVLEGLIGAKLLFGLEKVIVSGSFSAFSMSGQSLFGSVFLTFLLVPLTAKLLKKDTRLLYDYIAPFWILMLMFVRTGCFLQGCCGAHVYLIDGIPVVPPVQLFEVICDLLILQACFFMERKYIDWSSGKVGKAGGTLFFLVTMAYSLCRFVLEFVRDSVTVFLGLTFGQFYAIICISIGLCVIFSTRKKK